MNNDTLSTIRGELATCSEARLTRVLKTLGIAPSTWYISGRTTDEACKKPGPKPKPIPAAIEDAVVAMATAHPWYGYKRIAVMCRRAGDRVTNRQSCRVMKKHGLLQKPQARAAEIHQAAKLFELLPGGPNELWQMDVTYIHIPTFGWWYAVTVIDYYSRYLLACHLTPSYSALAATEALASARREAERVCGPLTRAPFLVTDNGSTFIAKRFMAFTREDYRQVRIRYRTPTQLGLLERFHRTLKEEEVYWRLYDDPPHARTCLAKFRTRYNELRPHWALVPESGGDPATPQEVYTSAVTPQLPRWQTWARAAREKLDKLMQPAAWRAARVSHIMPSKDST